MYALVITSNDGGEGFVCKTPQEVVDIVREHFDTEDSTGRANDVPEEKARMEKDISDFLQDCALSDGRVGCGHFEWTFIYGRSRWSECAHIGKIKEE